MDQLVAEIWTDVSTTPRDVLEFGLAEVIAWLADLRRQVAEDADFEHEDEELRDTWEKIDKFRSVKFRQGLMGGPPVVPLHEANVFPDLRASDCQYFDAGDHARIPQAPFSLPPDEAEVGARHAQRPKLDGLQWLAQQLQREEYSDRSDITAENFEKFLPAPAGDAFAAKDIDLLPVSSDVVASLRMVGAAHPQSGFNTMADLAGLSADELARFPSVPPEAAKAIRTFLDDNAAPNL